MECKKTETKGIFCKWCETTTFHGWSDYFSAPDTLGQVMWLILIAVCTFGLTGSVLLLCKEFDASDKWTTTVYESQDENVALSFPTLTFCNINRLRRSVAEEYNLTAPLRSYIFEHFDTYYPLMTEDNIIGPIATASNYTEWKNLHNGMSFLDILETMGHDKCISIEKLRVGKHPINQVCNYDDDELAKIGVTISDVISPEYGKCFQLAFNPAIYNVTATGTIGGVSIILDAEIEDYLPDLFANHMQEGFAFQAGYNGIFNVGQWTMIMPGAQTVIGLQKSITKKRSDSFNLYSPPCTENSFMTILPADKFTRENCDIDCQLAAIGDQCDCVPLTNEGRYPMCDLDIYDECMGKLKADPEAYDLFERNQIECARGCRSLCTSETIKQSLSLTRFPATNKIVPLTQLMKAFEKISQTYGKPPQVITTEKTEKSYSVVDVYFSTLQVQVVEHYELYTLTVLLSQIGGSLGLWAGISILTVFHAIIYCVYGVYEKLAYQCESKRNEKKSAVMFQQRKNIYY